LPPRILLFGETPLPYGGIQAHCLRLLAWLRAQGVDATLAHTPSFRLTPVATPRPEILPTRHAFWPILKTLRRVQPQLVHQHVYRWRVALILGHLRRHPGRFGIAPIKTVLTVHGEAFFATIPAPVRPLVHAALREFDHVLADNPMLLQRIQREAGVDPARTSLLGAFLPPEASERDPSLLPQELRAFAQSHRPLLVSNGAVATFKGEDKYGVDLMLEATRQLATDMPNLGAVFCVTAVHDEARWRLLQAEVERLGLGERFRFVRQLPSLMPLLETADATLRATNTDGDALSVHESLLLGTPALTSDVVVRPELADLFRNRDADDLTEVLRRVLARGRHPPEVAAQVRHAGPDILGLYERLLR
jgi:glycosyltransferase involved in cell wall biosynthesis